MVTTRLLFRRITLLSLVMTLALTAGFIMLTSPSNAGDGIPDNCEYTAAAYYRANIFPRYEPHNQRLVLVDWTTNAEVQEIATSLAETRIMGWSVDCRYLAVAVGTAESMDTVVFDTTNNVRVGSVPDAHLKPHPITWGPGNYLVVETRNGAILWNVPANTQVKLTESFDSITARNFSRIRWDAESGQIVVNLAVGGREVYDLATGQKVELAANLADHPYAAYYSPASNGSIVVAGKPYKCQVNRAEGNTPADLKLYYHPEAYTIAVLARLHYRSEELLVYLESKVTALSVSSRGWSPNCRYLAAAVEVKEDVYDTYVWDVVENRRMGIFPDAHIIPHPLRWSPSSDMLLVYTRDGAYLWQLATDTKILLTSAVETSLAGRRDLYSFDGVQWDTASHRLYTIPVDAPDTVRVYDTQTGTLVDTYPLETDRARFTGLTTYSYGTSTAPTLPASEVMRPVGTPVDGVSGVGTWSGNHWGRSGTCGNQFVRYLPDERQLLFIRSGDTVVSDVTVNPFYQTSWSSDCQYVATTIRNYNRATEPPYDDEPVDDYVYYTRRGAQVMIWDVATGERLITLDHPFRSYNHPDYLWSPGNDRVVVHVSSGKYLVNLQTYQVIRLPESFAGISSVYWDYPRGHLLGNGRVYDLATGELLFILTSRPLDSTSSHSYITGSLSISADGKTAFVVGGGVGIWNLDTLTSVFVDVDADAFAGNRIALSPDGRYLVMARSLIRVWDLANLPSDLEARDSVAFAGPLEIVYQAQFIDNVTVELTTDGGKIYHMNVATGGYTAVE